MTICFALLFPFTVTACTAIGVFAATVLGALLGGNRPPEIKARHLARKAAIYMRQSTKKQLDENTGSTDYQRDQVRYPRAWGWPDDLIEVIDGDLGLSGAAPGHRPAYNNLVSEIAADLIGALFLADLTRGGRDAEEWYRLLRLCQTHDTLIVVSGQVYDANNSADLLMTRLLATLAEHDNLTRRETMQRGRLTKASQGQPVSPPPAGFERHADKRWHKDHDPNVRAAITAVVRAILAERSCKKAVVALKRAGVKLPRRRRGQLWWAEPTVTKVCRLVKHPALAGIYPFRQRLSDPRLGRDSRGRLRLRPAEPHERIEIPDNHDAYITPAEREEILTIIRLNAPSETRRNLGPGTALVQGFIRCAIHRLRAMTAVYKAARRDGGRSHAYYCLGDYFEGGAQCGHIPGRLVDEAVTSAIIARLAPPRLETLRAALQEVAAGERSEHYRQKLERDRIRRDVTVLEEKFFSLDPSSTELAKDTERRLETRKRELRDLERLLDADAPATLTFGDDAMAELIQLCADLHALWTAPTTTAQDRKQLARLVIDRVVVEYRDAERVRLRVEWADGGPAAPITFTLPEHVNVLIEEMRAAGLVAQQIADQLNELGIPTQSGNRWQHAVVAKKIGRLIRRRAERDGAAGPIRRRGRKPGA